MKTIDQVEQLTDTARQIVNVQPVLERLPALDPESESLKDLIAKDRAEVDNTIVRSLLRALTWAMFIVALGVVALLIRAVARGYLK